MKVIHQHRISILSLLIGLTILVGAFAGCRFIPACRQPIEPYLVEHHVRAPVNVFVSQYFSQFRPRRVVIVAPVSRTNQLPEQEVFSLALADSLRQAGFSEAVVSLPADCDTLAIRKGKFDLQQVVDLSDEYAADSILYCDVVSFSPYSPLQVSVSLTMVDARESVALMAIDGTWDLSDPQTQSSYLRHLSRYGEDDDFRNRIKYRSPTEFLRFVSLDLARFMNLQ